MAFLKRIPKWIRNFPLSLDKQALEQLAESSNGPFDKTREMNFVLYGFRKDTNLTAALVKIQDAGWECSTQAQAEAPGQITLTATKRNYIITEDAYKRDTIFFEKLADLHHAQYDGWLASN